MLGFPWNRQEGPRAWDGTEWEGLKRRLDVGLQVVVVVASLSHVQLFVTPWTGACQAPLSIGSFRQEHWSGSPFPSPENIPNPGIKLGSSALQAACQSPLSIGLFRQEHWSGSPFPSPENIPNPGIKLGSSALPHYRIWDVCREDVYEAAEQWVKVFFIL